MAKGTWILERTQNDRFPYRLQIIRGDRPWLVLRTQDRWPTAGRHIFCLREDEPPSPDEVLEELERVDIIAFNERGRRISVVLDRKRYKRCDFLFLKKSSSNISRACLSPPYGVVEEKYKKEELAELEKARCHFLTSSGSF